MLEHIARTGITPEGSQAELAKQTRARLLAERALGFQDLGVSLLNGSDWKLLERLGTSPQAYFDAILSMENLDTPVGREYQNMLRLISTTPRYG